jgi:all-trans-8'-apo-beta-carotenal 15,15'-oxygenase
MSWLKLPLSAADWLPPADNPLPYAGLLSSLPEEYDYECEFEGQLPDIAGSLYRVGPGRYDRGPDRKRMMLDGDGMVQQLSIRNGRAHFRNRYVRTPKYLAEERADRFLYPTFSTHGSGPLRYNLGLKIVNQANTTVLEWAGRLYAFDEGQKPYELDGRLGTLGESILDAEQPKLGYWAHWKLDPVHQRLHLLSLVPGPKPSARIVSLDRNGQVAERQTIPLPRSVYIHDWFVTPNHFCLLLHPAYLSVPRLLEVMIARNTFASAIEWQPEKGSVLTVAKRGRADPPRNLPVRPIWMWHAINAFEDGEDLVLDFIGGEVGGGLSDDDPVFGLMGGHDPGPPPAPSNFPRRLRVRPDSDTPEVQTILDDGNFELPCVSATERGRPYTQAYMIRAIPGELFARTLCELDGKKLAARHYEFGPREFCSEPVICDELDGQPGRYLLTQIYNGADKRSYYAVMDRQNFMAGPVARIQLRHHVPVSFHGYWSAAVLD